MIQVNNLRFSYGQDDFSLQIDELSIHKGQSVAWTGHSGSGKTTLLHLVAGIVLPETGRLESCEVELTGLRDSARRDFRIRNIGLVLQDFELFEYMSVLDNILLPYRINRSLQLTSSVRTRAKQLANEMGLEQLILRRPTNLSHGEQQRVAVCRALITNPKMVLADEPTANLDPGNASRVLDALDLYTKQNGATLVVVTHDNKIHNRFDRTIDVSSFCFQTQSENVGDLNDER
ncbi:MAG: ATP-binding cassette domain-containing protein [Planctomycetes bacterium]|nr:ATP-binding cassette domain-containing protein [Planctomycetota bacterium]MCH9725294.1 ATP-binding cassette domain-containing protein [Planctomycetota bacterium]MCH9779486.1 ATP-binding cassette domain-containing protein [Planctomycetota bacterium]MCH9792623.1 ATP-binding cassette domain-containing protein [Planctomycetota bacterium]